MQSRSEAVRAAAARALGRLAARAPERAGPLLEKAVRDPAYDVRSAALPALAVVWARTLDARTLGRTLVTADDDSTRRFVALEALVALGQRTSATAGRAERRPRRAGAHRRQRPGAGPPGRSDRPQLRRRARRRRERLHRTPVRRVSRQPQVTQRPSPVQPSRADHLAPVIVVGVEELRGTRPGRSSWTSASTPRPSPRTARRGSGSGIKMMRFFSRRRAAVRVQRQGVDERLNGGDVRRAALRAVVDDDHRAVLERVDQVSPRHRAGVRLVRGPAAVVIARRRRVRLVRHRLRAGDVRRPFVRVLLDRRHALLAVDRACR